MAVTASKAATIPDERLNPGTYRDYTFGPFGAASRTTGDPQGSAGAGAFLKLRFATEERLILCKAWASSETVSSITDSTAQLCIVRKAKSAAVPSGTPMTTLNDARIMDGFCVGLQTTGTPATGGDGSSNVPIILVDTAATSPVAIPIAGNANVIEPGDELYLYSQSANTALVGLQIHCRFRVDRPSAV